jgi:transposase
VGRTVAPFSQILATEFKNLSDFRHALDREGRKAFDRLFAAAKFHLPAMIYASRPLPLEAIMMSILLEQHKALTQLEEATRTLGARIQPLSDPPAPA